VTVALGADARAPGARTRSLLAELRIALPAGAVLTDDESLRERAFDAKGGPADGVPIAVVRPVTTAHVSAVARIAYAHGTPLVPQGAMSGLAGGANTVDGAILIDFGAMNAIVRIDAVDQVAVVQPGVVTETLALAVAEQGLFYPPDPASSTVSTIGGNIATNAGGMRCVKYGVTGDFVRSLEIVLADGRIVRTSAPTVKVVAGLDLTSLVVGSEGTLAIVTEATLALLAAPGETQGVCATFATSADALAAANAIMASPRRPSTLEFLDGVVLAAIAAYLPDSGLPAGAHALLLALTDSRDGGADDVAAYERIVREHSALVVDVATDPVRLDGLLAARRAFNSAIRAVRGGSIDEDIAVPRTRLPELLERLDALSVEVGLPIGTGGHVGDGNLHPGICYDPADPAQLEAAEFAHSRILALAAELGGTVTGEHGIGVEKLEALDVELGPTVRELQWAIKAAFDPTGILNPGKKL
jgi:glycolate oxidase